MQCKIVVLTPVKNEDWILDSFLRITSRFADLIIVYDDNSKDNSKKICQKYDKVYLIEGKENSYNEIRRQEILINKARELITEDKVLLALDADEIIIHDALKSEEWINIRNANKGTVLFFEKPDIIFNYNRCFRHKNKFSLGYVDDGIEHFGNIVHSTRIPVCPASPKLYLDKIKFMHFALLRFEAYLARQRFYKVVENVNNTKTLLMRYEYYNGGIYEIKRKKKDETPIRWYKKWIEEEFLPLNFPKREYYWYDLEIIKYFQEFGVKRFHLDDIWSFDYNKLLEQTTQNLQSNPVEFKYPDWTHRFLIKSLKILAFGRLRAKQIWRSKINLTLQNERT